VTISLAQRNGHLTFALQAYGYGEALRPVAGAEPHRHVVFAELHSADQLEIRPSEQRITLLHPPGYDYFRLLRSKLHWGRGADQHER